MKRNTWQRVILLALAIIMTMSLMLTASAEDVTGVTEGGTDKNWNYKAMLVDANATSGMYILIVFKQAKTEETPSKPSTFSADDILYIDQIVTTESGKVTFENWIPKTYAGGAAWIFGGSISEFVGWLTSHGIQLKGKVSSSIKGATVSIAGQTTTTDASGNFQLDSVPEGSYELVISKTYYLTYRKAVTVVTDSGDGSCTIIWTEDDNSFAMYGGDIDSNGKINSTDLGLLLDHLGESGEGIVGDLNDSGAVNSTDLGTLLDGIGHSETDIAE